MTPQDTKENTAHALVKGETAKTITRINSRDLLGKVRELEIDHEGRIYRLRLTQLNKLILTA